MTKRLTSNGRAVVRQDERSASRRRRGAEEPQLEPPPTNGADRRAAELSASARHDDGTADLRKPKKKSKKKRPEASVQGLHESPTTYHPGPASPSGSMADVTADARARPALPVVKKNIAAKKDKAGTERGIETMYRGAYRTQLDLTNLADTKANIMISINGLILSVVLAAGGFIANLEPWLLVPVAALVLTCITAMFFAVQAARPRLPKTGELTPDDFISGDANVLFFQHFGACRRTNMSA